MTAPCSPTPKTAIVSSLMNVFLLISSLYVFVFLFVLIIAVPALEHLEGRKRERCVACLEDETELD